MQCSKDAPQGPWGRARLRQEHTAWNVAHGSMSTRPAPFPPLSPGIAPSRAATGAAGARSPIQPADVSLSGLAAAWRDFFRWINSLAPALLCCRLWPIRVSLSALMKWGRWHLPGVPSTNCSPVLQEFLGRVEEGPRPLCTCPGLAQQVPPLQPVHLHSCRTVLVLNPRLSSAAEETGPELATAPGITGVRGGAYHEPRGVQLAEPVP